MATDQGFPLLQNLDGQTERAATRYDQIPSGGGALSEVAAASDTQPKSVYAIAAGLKVQFTDDGSPAGLILELDPAHLAAAIKKAVVEGVALDVGGKIRATGDGVPASGKGVEIALNGSDQGRISAINRDTAAALDLILGNSSGQQMVLKGANNFAGININPLCELDLNGRLRVGNDSGTGPASGAGMELLYTPSGTPHGQIFTFNRFPVGSGYLDTSLRAAPQVGLYLYALNGFVGGYGNTGPLYAFELTNTASTAGRIRAQRFDVYSDPSFKAEKEPLADGDALALIRAIAPIRYRRDVATIQRKQRERLRAKNPDLTEAEIREMMPEEEPPAQPDDPKLIGFDAKTVAAILPNVASADERGEYAMDYGQMTPILWQAVQAQDRVIQQLQQRLAVVESR